MSDNSNRNKVLKKLQALMIYVGSDRNKHNAAIQSLANDIDELYKHNSNMENK